MNGYGHAGEVPFADNSPTQRMTCSAPQYLTAEKYVFSMARYGNQPMPFNEDLRPELPQTPDNSLMT